MDNTYQKAWDKVLQQSLFPWWEWDIKSNTVSFSDLKARMLDYAPEHFHNGGYRAFTDLLHPDDHDAAMDAMRMVLDGRTNLYQIDYRIKNAGGEYVWFMDRGIVVERDKEGRPLKIRGVVIDLGMEFTEGRDLDALLAVVNRSATAAEGRYSFLTLCSVCMKAKKDEKIWIDLPADLSELIGEKISHGICPDCMQQLYPDIADKVLYILNGKTPPEQHRSG
jgi:hypothetical protein